MLRHAPLVVLGFFASTAVFAQSMDERVRNLERRVEQLEKQSGRQAAGSANPSPIVGQQDGWKRLENWRSLKRGMNEADVKALLGEPHRVDAGAVTFWYYNPPMGGDVHFINSGLAGWSEPRR